jgi:cell division protein FtsZ
VQGISELITEEGLINLDFADVSKIMRNAGSALIGIGRASGENRAELAAKQAIESPLIEVSIDGARGVLFNVIGGDNMSMDEINEVAETIRATVAPDANIIFGANIRPELDDEIIVTVVATGFDASYGSPVEENKIEDSSQKKEDLDEIVAPNVKVDDTNIDNDIEIKPQVDTEDFVRGETSNSWLSSDEKDDDKQVDEITAPKEEELDEPAFSRVQKWFRKRKNQADKEDDPHAL